MNIKCINNHLKEYCSIPNSSIKTHKICRKVSYKKLNSNINYILIF